MAASVYKSLEEAIRAMEIRDIPGVDRVKVGRLKPGDGRILHLFVDGVGE